MTTTRGRTQPSAGFDDDCDITLGTSDNARAEPCPPLRMQAGHHDHANPVGRYHQGRTLPRSRQTPNTGMRRWEANMEGGQAHPSQTPAVQTTTTTQQPNAGGIKVTATRKAQSHYMHDDNAGAPELRRERRNAMPAKRRPTIRNAQPQPRQRQRRNPTPMG
jgi:hypothetical protein